MGMSLMIFAVHVIGTAVPFRIGLVIAFVGQSEVAPKQEFGLAAGLHCAKLDSINTAHKKQWRMFEPVEFVQ